MSSTPGDGDQFAERLVDLSLEPTSYPSLPHPGSRQSPASQTYSNIHTPSGRGSAPYSPFPEDNAQFVYYPANPTLATHPAFSPLSNSPHTATLYSYDLSTAQAIGQDLILDAGFPTLAEPFSMAHSEVNRVGRGRGEGGNAVGVYRPPQAQQQQHHQSYQQHQQQHQQQQQQQQQAAVMQQYYGYGAAQGQMWWTPPMGNIYSPAPDQGAGERKKDQTMNGLQSHIPPFNTAVRNTQPSHTPYTQTSSTFMNTPLPGLPLNYALMTPQTPSYLGTRGGGGHNQTPRGQGGFVQGSHGLIYPHTPYTPARPQAGRYGKRISDSNNLPRSAVLEDFRLNKVHRKFDLNEVFGHIIEFAGDQHGSRFIQQKLENCTAEERQQNFDEILPNSFQIMTDVFGNYVVQKMFELGDQRQKASLANRMESHVLALSMQMYGCRVVQKALEYVLVEQRNKLIAELEPHILECVRSANANHVIQRLVTLDPPQSVPDAFLGHVAELATDPYGCRVVQKLFEVLPESMTRELLNELHPHAVTLMQDPFGNYVVQSIIVSGTPPDRDRIVDQLKGQMISLSRHKFGSNVCEKALQHAKAEDRRLLITELIDMQPDGKNQIGMLLRDAFGNFPIQTALTCADDDQRAELLDLIIPNIQHIRSTPVGKRLEAGLTRWEAEGLIASATEQGANVAAYLAAQAPSSQTQTHRKSLSSSASSDSSCTPHSMSASSSTGGTSPTFPQIDKNLRSTASTPIRGPLSFNSRKYIEKTESEATVKDLEDDKDAADKDPAHDEKTLATLLQ